MELVDIMIRWLINLLRKNSPEPTYDGFNFSVGLNVDNTTFYMDGVFHVDIRAEKPVITQGRHYPRNATIRSHSISDLHLLETIINDHDKIGLNINLFEQERTLKFAVGHIDSMKYTISIGYDEPFPVYNIVLGLYAAKGLTVDAENQTIG